MSAAGCYCFDFDAISDTEIIRKVKHFNVSHLTSISDHCSIKVSSEVDFNVQIPKKLLLRKKPLKDVSGSHLAKKNLKT